MYSTVQYSTIQYITLQCSTVQYSTLPYCRIKKFYTDPHILFKNICGLNFRVKYFLVSVPFLVAIVTYDLYGIIMQRLACLASLVYLHLQISLSNNVHFCLHTLLLHLYLYFNFNFIFIFIFIPIFIFFFFFIFI